MPREIQMLNTASCRVSHSYQKNVIPVKTGIQFLMVSCLRMDRVWTPAFAGVTVG